MRNVQIAICFIAFLLLLAGSQAHAQPPADLDRFVGAYKATSIMVFHIRREGSDLYLRPTGMQNEMALLQQGANSFADTMSAGQFTFSGEGPDTVLTARNGSSVFHARRISEQDARALEDAVAARIKAGMPSPGTETYARRYIGSLDKGVPNYDEMESRVADDVRSQLPSLVDQIHHFGALQSLTFVSVTGNGMDLYKAQFEHAHVMLGVAPLDAEGKVEFQSWSAIK